MGTVHEIRRFPFREIRHSFPRVFQARKTRRFFSRERSPGAADML